MTPGERRFAERLESHLEDDYLCWYDVPVGSHGFHPDFIILNPRRGILIVEVKDWKRETIQSIDRNSATLLTDRGAKQTPNPIEQARQYAHAVKSMLERDPALVMGEKEAHAGKLRCPWGYGVVLSNLSRKVFTDANLGEVIPEGRVICQDEMTESVDREEFQKRLWSMFTVQFRTLLSMPQIDRVRWHLFPEIRITHEQGSLSLGAASNEKKPDEIVSDLLLVMDLQQEQLARSLGDGHRIIHGVAGSGKTMILGYRAAYLAQALAKPILILCYNVALAARLQHVIKEKKLADKVSVCNFHKWCMDQLRLYHVERPEDGKDFAERLVTAVTAAVEKGQIPRAQYGAVLIDEGHDFEAEWLKLIVHMIDPETNLLLLLYDDAQSIYGERDKRTFSFKSVGIQAQGRTTILKLNYRNTAEVLQVAYEFAKEVLEPSDADEDGVPLLKPESAGRHGPAPEFITCSSVETEVRELVRRLREFRKAGAEWMEMGVLCPTNYACERVAKALAEAEVPVEWLGQSRKSRRFQPEADSVKIMTIHSSKGLEFPVVVISGIGQMPLAKSTPEEDAKLLYVGMTRAMVHLVMTSCADSEFSKRLQGVSGLASTH